MRGSTTFSSQSPVSISVQSLENGHVTCVISNLHLVSFIEMCSSLFTVSTGIVHTWLEESQCQRHLPWNISSRQLMETMEQGEVIHCELVTNLGFQIESDLEGEIVLDGISWETAQMIVNVFVKRLVSTNYSWKPSKNEMLHLQIRPTGIYTYTSFSALVEGHEAERQFVISNDFEEVGYSHMAS